MTAVDFTDAWLKKNDLTGSRLEFSVFVRAQLEETNFLSTNLSYADLRNATCPRFHHIQCTLSLAISLENALLPEVPDIGVSIPLIYYGYPQCNSTTHLPANIMGNEWMMDSTGSVFLQYRDLTDPHL